MHDGPNKPSLQQIESLHITTPNPVDKTKGRQFHGKDSVVSE
jgi:hypothetical protein